MEMVERVAAAIDEAAADQMAFIRDSSAIARAAIAAMRDELSKLPNTQYALDTMSAALGGNTDAA